MMTDNGNTGADEVEDKPTETDPSEYVLCYLTCPQDAAGAFVGALMLTDGRARPLHFGYVSPIKPTAIQRVIYGPTLREHVKIDVIASKLFKGMPQAPQVVFVDSQELLSARRLISSPLAHLARNESGKDESSSLSALVYATNENTHDRDTVGAMIALLESQIDLIEPFVRMIEALKEAMKAGGK
jgi:hypothetical protein